MRVWSLKILLWLVLTLEILCIERFWNYNWCFLKHSQQQQLNEKIEAFGREIDELVIFIELFSLTSNKAFFISVESCKRFFKKTI